MFNRIVPGKFFLVLVLFLFFNQYANAQTWINSPVYPFHQTPHNNYLSVGPLEFAATNDSCIYGLIRIDQDETTHLIKYNSSGQMLFNFYLAHSPTLASETAFSLFACPDNGCVYVKERLGSMYGDFEVSRRSKNGALLWMIDYNTNFNPSSPSVKKVIPTYYNTSIIHFWGDSLNEVDSSGTLVRSRLGITGDILSVPDSDIVVVISGAISRQSFSGNIIWSVSGNGNPIFADSDFIYVRNNSMLLKLRSNDGSTVWSKYFGSGDVSIKKDGGILSCGLNEICNYDFSGNLIWCRVIPFPSFGYKKIMECTPNCFVTGGASPFMSIDYLFLDTAWGSFTMSIDSTGHGVVDSTDHFLMGNANDNNTFSFADDAPFVATAIGASGSPRCPVFQSPFNAKVGYSTDWNTQFGIGVNHKYSDIDGNGVINISDLMALPLGTFYPRVAPIHWRSPSTNLFPDLKIVYEEDTVIAGDTVTVHLILGNLGLQIDSIYAFALQYYYAPFLGAGGRAIIPVSDFGNPVFDLFNYFSIQNSAVLFSLNRTDHQNRIFNYDTIAIFRLATSSQLNFSGMLAPQVSINAITEAGFTVNLNLNVDSLYYFNPSVDVNVLFDNSLNIYPNPANDFINIEFDGNADKISIYNITGKEVFEQKVVKSKMNINIHDLNQGVYYILIQKKEGVLKKRITIIR